MGVASSTHTSDLFHNFLTTKCKLTPFRAFIALLVIGLLDELLLGYLTGHWNSAPGVVGAKDDYPHWIVAFLFQPGVWAFFIWLPAATESIYNLIEAKAIPEDKTAAFRAAKEKFFDLLDAPWISLCSLALGILLIILSLYYTSQYTSVPWTYHVAWHRYTIWSFRLLAVGYCFSFSILYSILVMVNLNQVFARYGVRLHLYDGDNVAGLKFIGDFALQLNRLALLSLSFLVGDILLAIQVGKGITGQGNLILEFVAFPIAILFSFVAPLIACRRAMQEAKIAELNKKAAQIQDQLDRLEKTDAPTNDQVEDLSALVKFRQQLGADIPTLPIDISALRTFTLSFTLSLIPALIGVVLNLINFFKSLFPN